MEVVQITKYKCAVCGAMYDKSEQAQECESKPVSGDKGAKVGDRIVVTSGEGAGKMATVESRYVYDKNWGHYQWKRYWHTVGLTAKMDDWGHRQLTFDSYELA